MDLSLSTFASSAVFWGGGTSGKPIDASQSDTKSDFSAHPSHFLPFRARNRLSSFVFIALQATSSSATIDATKRARTSRRVRLWVAILSYR